MPTGLIVFADEDENEVGRIQNLAAAPACEPARPDTFHGLPLDSVLVDERFQRLEQLVQGLIKVGRIEVVASFAKGETLDELRQEVERVTAALDDGIVLSLNKKLDRLIAALKKGLQEANAHVEGAAKVLGRHVARQGGRLMALEFQVEANTSLGKWKRIDERPRWRRSLAWVIWVAIPLLAAGMAFGKALL